MDTREVLLKADKVVLVIERISDGKIRVTTTSWDDAKVILPNQVLEVATIGKQVGLVRVDKPIAYLAIRLRHFRQWVNYETRVPPWKRARCCSRPIRSCW
jgi:hypothetical protein